MQILMSEKSSLNSNNWNLKIFKLKFHSPVAGEVDSIKLYGALLHSMKILYPDKFSDFYNDIKQGKIAVSSLIPVVNNEVLLFKPMLWARVNMENRKNFKKIRYIPIDKAREVLEKGEYTPEQVEDLINWAKDKNFPQLMIEEDIPKVSIPKTGGKTNIFYENVKYLFGNWAVIIKEGNFSKEILSCLKYLGEHGVSKKVSWGLGRFDIVDRENFTYRISSGDYCYLLSKFAPQKNEIKSIDFHSSYYEIKTIVGRTRAGKSFKQITLVEGSVLKLINKNVCGKVVELRSRDYEYSACFVALFV